MLAGIETFEYFPVKQRLRRERASFLRVFLILIFKIPAFVYLVCIFLEIVYHTVSHCIAEGCFLPPENVIRKPASFFECLPQKVFSVSVAVHFHLGID